MSPRWLQSKFDPIFVIFIYFVFSRMGQCYCVTIFIVSLLVFFRFRVNLPTFTNRWWLYPKTNRAHTFVNTRIVLLTIDLKDCRLINGLRFLLGQTVKIGQNKTKFIAFVVLSARLLQLKGRSGSIPKYYKPIVEWCCFLHFWLL